MTLRSVSKTMEPLLGGAGLYLALYPLVIVLFFSSLFTGSMFLYNAAQSVFPHICPEGTPLSACFMVSGLPSHWSHAVWLPVAVSFGWFTRGQPIAKKVTVGCLVIVAVMVLFQALISVFGWNQYIDAL